MLAAVHWLWIYGLGAIAAPTYVAITAHIISDDWNKKSCTHEVTSTHTADNIAGELLAVITEWNLVAKVIGNTTNNAGNVENAVDSFTLAWASLENYKLSLYTDEDYIYKLAWILSFSTFPSCQGNHIKIHCSESVTTVKALAGQPFTLTVP